MAFLRATAFAYLRRAFAQKRLAHAYLISGAPGSGKRALASDLANLVNGASARDVFAQRPLGIHIAEPESKSRRIVVEQIRELEQTLQMRAETGRQKVAIIVDADRLQPQAANAFLKTLEEPPNDSLLLLLSAVPEVLPDTILSRCITISLAHPETVALSSEEDELVKLLNESAVDSAKGVRLAYRLAQGTHSLLARIKEGIVAENAAALKRDETKYKNTTDGAWLEAREDYFKALTESLYIQRRAHLIETLYRWWSDVLRASTGVVRRELPEARQTTTCIADKLSTAQILQRIRRIEEMRDHLGRNIQEALAIEVAFLNVFSF